MKPQHNVNRLPPAPWAVADHLPWDDPDFSDRMLREHLSQQHDAASRRLDTIERHVQWIDGTVLSGHASRILDLGCGPGFYLHRLAARGHDCVGIDYSPASIAYAKDAADQARLAIRYVLEDVRNAQFGSGHDLIMMIYGEFNVFPGQDASGLLLKCASALAEGGTLLLEPHTFDAVLKRGQESSSQYLSESGLFLGSPHICVQDNFWDPSGRAATTRWTVTDTATGRTAVHAASYQAYTDQEYKDLLKDCGFTGVEIIPSLTGRADDQSESLMVLRAGKSAA